MPNGKNLSRGARTLVGLLWMMWLLTHGLSAFAAQAPVASGLTVKGTVSDQHNHPVAGADVALTVGKATVRQTTGDNGGFTLNDVPAGDGILTVRANGFAPFQRTWSNQQADATNLAITLTAASVAEQITVTAERAETRLSDTPSSVIVLSTEDLATTAALTLDDVLRQVPGFTLFRRTSSRTSNPTSQGVSLRGVGASGASRAVVLNDGIPINDPFGGWVYWSRVPRESVSRVEVVQGGTSSLYGTDALGGVISFLPRDVRDSVFSFETSAGNQGTYDASMFAAGRLFQWSGQVAIETFHTDGYIPVDESERGAVDTRAASQHTTFQVGLDRLLADRGRIFARASLFDEDRENGTPLTPNDTTIRQLALGADWNSDQVGAITARLFASTQVYDQNFSAIAANRQSETLTRSQRVPAQQIGFSSQWSRVAGSRQTLIAGFDAREVRGASDELVFTAGRVTSAVGAGGRERTFGVFGQDIIRVAPRLLVTVGVRGDRWRNYDAFSASRPLATPGAVTVTKFTDRVETAFSPRLSLLYKVSDHLSLYATGSRAFRAPTLNELYRSFRVGNVLTQANVNLRAERLTGGEAGARVTAFAERLAVRGTFFWSELTRPIANVTLSVTPTLITRQRQNLGRTRSRGVEFETDARLSRTVSLSGGYQFADATVLRFPANRALEGLLIPQTPRHQLTFQARYDNPAIVTVSLQGRAVGTQFDDDQNQLQLNRYFALDLFASRRLGRNIEVFAAFENLTDERYDIGRTPVRTIGPPLMARAGLRLHFGAR
ncbi:MAG TPA: TonB-dependent receptor [Blastocatellia bacterium]|nr:TonB-dependent receptor [Blastocatellia bacterium]